jgi:tetratricopeptide (TPR) repeat protein
VCVATIVAIVLFSGEQAVEPNSDGDREQLEEKAWNALVNGKDEEAEHWANQVLKHFPESNRALLCAGQATYRLQEYDRCLAYYRRVVNNGSDASRTARCLMADVLFFIKHRVSEAEATLKSVLREDEDHGFANQSLGVLYLWIGRRRLAYQHLLRAIANDCATKTNLLHTGWSAGLFGQRSFVAACRKVEPENTSILLGIARRESRANRPEIALQLIREALQLDSADLEIQAVCGRLLLKLNRLPEFAEWHASLPVNADSSEDIWFVRGLWLRHQNQTEAAARCFWECVRRNPNHDEGNYQFGRSLSALGRTAESTPFLQRSRDLAELNLTCSNIDSGPDSMAMVLKAARLTESLGRLWEAFGWYQLAVEKNANHRSAARKRDALALQVSKVGYNHLESPAALTQSIDLSHVALPSWAQSVEAVQPVASVASSQDVICFKNDAQSAGVRFIYENADDPGETGMRMIETMGGGVAVLDYDRDGWPDLYFSQGGEFPPKQGQRQVPDELFRNLGDGTFLNLTRESGLGDANFTHGVTVGDYDSDGWPDLYIANVGRNRLYHNNGDGTFADVTDEASILTEKWTVSCLLADLNGDTHPDIYDVNYLRGNDPLTQLCTNAQGIKRACAPSIYDAEFDQLLLNDGQGGYRNISDSSGINIQNGKGLGIVAADFDGSGALDVFIANDTVANFFFTRQSTAHSESPFFNEQGLVSGLAYDQGGNGQASMGVAADDVDGDGRLDLFVTNFFKEFNALYLQGNTYGFEDATSNSGLGDPGFQKLGFGTQFLDADLDGWPDLVVANGHIDDFTHQRTPFRMSPQAFRNTGSGHFQEMRPESLGPYFERKLVGRSLAKLDWNRDGKEDFVVSHLFDSVALLTNTTQTDNHWLALQLSGTRSNRDAIGTTVTVETAGRKIVNQLTSGSGYAASNQRRMLVGLGRHERITELRVHWLSGNDQVFHNIAADREYLLVEGMDSLLPLAVAD